MKPVFKVLLIVAISLILVGALVTVLALNKVNFNLKGIGTVQYEEKTSVFDKDVGNIRIESTRFDVNVLPSEANEIKVVYPESDNVKFDVAVNDDTLCVLQEGAGNFSLNFVSILASTPDVNVYLPAKQYKSLSIKVMSGSADVAKCFTFGDIDITGESGSLKCESNATDEIEMAVASGSLSLDGVSAKEITLRSTSGKCSAASVICNDIDAQASSGSVRLENVVASGNINAKATSGKCSATNVVCNDIDVQTSSGSVHLENVVASGNINAKATSGSIRFVESDGKNITAKATSGSIKGSILTEKIFNASSSGGSVSVPKSTVGAKGECNLETTSGSIRISVGSAN